MSNERELADKNYKICIVHTSTRIILAQRLYSRHWKVMPFILSLFAWYNGTTSFKIPIAVNTIGLNFKNNLWSSLCSTNKIFPELTLYWFISKFEKLWAQRINIDKSTKNNKPSFATTDLVCSAFDYAFSSTPSTYLRMHPLYERRERKLG